MVVNKMESIFTKYLSSLFFLQIFVSFSLFCTFVALFVHYRLFLFCRSLKLHSLLFSLCSLSYFIYTNVCVFVCEYRYFFLFYKVYIVYFLSSPMCFEGQSFSFQLLLSILTFSLGIFLSYAEILYMLIHCDWNFLQVQEYIIAVWKFLSDNYI